MGRLPLINYSFSGTAAKNRDGSQIGQPQNASFTRVNASLPDWGVLPDAISFRGSGSFLSVPLQPLLRATTGFAVEMAIRLTALGEDRMNLFQGWMPGCSLNLRRNGGGYSLRAAVNTPKSWQGMQTELPVIMPNTWTSVALVQAGDDLIALVNGKAVARRVFRPAVLTPFPDRDFAIGCLPDGPAYQFLGDVAGLRIWGEVPPHLEQSIAEAERTGLGCVDSKYLDLQGAAGPLGAPVGPEQPVGRGRMRSYSGADIFWSPERGAHVVQGAILAHYRRLGGPSSVLGFPLTDEEARPTVGARVSIFESGAIYWTPTDGTHEVHGEIFLHYSLVGGAVGPLGLPISDELTGVGQRSEFKGGTIFWSPDTGASALSGDVLNCYRYQMGGAKGPLGLPVSGVNDILTREGNVTGGRMACFQNGAIYQGRQTGSHGVQGDILRLYQQMGGPLGKLGYPKSNEQGVPNSDVRYNDFENGVIFWTPQKAARCLTALQLHMGMVRSDYIEDGIEFTPLPVGDHTAELMVFTTVNVNGQARETNRQQGDHHGKTYDINKNYDVASVSSATTIDFKIRVLDYDSGSSDEYLATIEKRFDVSNGWGMNNDLNGLYIGQQATERSKDAPRPNSVLFDYRIGPPSETISPDEPFRQRAWWNFYNFPTPVLGRRTYASTFEDVEVAESDWEKFVHLWDTIFYALFYKRLAATGNCFGNSLEAQFALTGSSVFAEPIKQYSLTSGVMDLINIRHGYQLSSAHVRWIIGRMLTLEVLRPSKIYERVRATLDGGQKTLISMVQPQHLTKGHTVLAYDYENGVGGAPHKIFVADPNVWTFRPEDPRPSVIEILGDNFRFLTKHNDGLGEVYEMFKTNPVADLFGSTFMFDSPCHVFSAPPRTPTWEILVALLGFVGMAFIVGGPADIVALTLDGTDYYQPTARGPAIIPNAVPGFSRIPVCDGGPDVPEFYAQRGYPAQKIDMTVRGRQGSGSATRFQYAMWTCKNAIVLDSPIATSSNDRISISGTRTSAPLFEATTDEAGKVARLTYSVLLDDRGRAAYGVEADWGMARGATARFSASPRTAGFTLEHAGPAVPINLTFTTIENGQARRSVLRLPANPANRVLRMRPSDWLSPHNNVAIEGLDSFDGAVIARYTGTVNPL
ncbi:MAG TPA: LamG-like jellyroll fold domain-containing protein [Pyrinomonadaceae bacterium]|nr:LamG-like jellyroll fold domain-containing protein [Pyrinomonadaceae bacterium]